MREAGINCMLISKQNKTKKPQTRSITKPVFVSGLQGKPSPYVTGHLLYYRLKKRTWAKKQHPSKHRILPDTFSRLPITSQEVTNVPQKCVCM